MQALFTQLVVGLVVLLSGCTVSLYVTPHSTVVSTTAAAPEVAAPETPPTPNTFKNDIRASSQPEKTTVTPPPGPPVVSVVTRPCKLEPLPYRSSIPEPLALRNPEVVDADQVNSVLVDHILVLRKFINDERRAIKTFYVKQQRLCQQ